MEINPCSKDGGGIGDDYVDSPEELIGKGLFFHVKITNAMGLNSKYDKV